MRQHRLPEFEELLAAGTLDAPMLAPLHHLTHLPPQLSSPRLPGDRRHPALRPGFSGVLLDVQRPQTRSDRRQ
eukprot:3758051-Prymnesium_polylepis.1